MKEHFEIKETIVTIIADEQKFIDVAKSSIHFNRSILEAYIISDPFFKTTLEPYNLPSNAPEIIRRMIIAGNTMQIGPMGAVAGTIAAMAVEEMVNMGAKYAIVDNGGDIALINDRIVNIGVFAGLSPVKNLAFEFQPRNNITGVCTSSATVGPSISFGMADAAIVFSDDISLADAAATALGNATSVGKEGVKNAFSCIKTVSKITGAVIIQDEYIGMYGRVPKILKADVNYDCITKG